MLKKFFENNKKEKNSNKEVVSKNIKQPLCISLERNIAILKSIFIDDETINFRWITNAHNPSLKYCLVQNDGLVSSVIINENIIKPLMVSDVLLNQAKPIDVLIQQVISVNQVKKTNDWQEIIEAVTYGDTILFMEGEKEALLLNSKGFNVRSIEEPSGEKIISGPREGFCEALMVNLSLVKRRLRTNELKIKFQSLGVRTHTQVCICYIDSIVDKRILAELQKRLGKIKIDGVLDSNYITECISDFRWSPFRTTGYTERPDIVVANLLEGRIALFVDGSPVVLTIPYFFIENFQSNEDYYLSFYYTSFERILRICAFLLTITIPSFFILLIAYNHEILPTILLTNIARDSLDVPLPASVEAILMLIVFEILKEAGIRIPSGIGQALSIVGALVIGQAAVEARLVSAPMVVVIATTAITGLLVPKLSASIAYIRIILLILSSTLGLIGFILGLAALLIHLLNLHSFGIPQMSPIEKLNYQQLKDIFIRGPWWKMINRPLNLTKNKTRLKNSDRGECD